MNPLSINITASGTGIERDGAFLPLLIDTNWAAFSDVPEGEWRLYLRLRRRQGFTAVIVTVLPIVHDRTEGRESRYPFARRPDGTFDWATPEADYVGHVRRYVEIARREFGLEVFVTVLWNNYLPGTWGSRLEPYVVMPADVRRAHVERVVDALADLEPVFVVSGDDGFDSAEANDAYRETIATMRERAPDALVTTHGAPAAQIPDDILDRLDLYLFQSGHNVAQQALAWETAERLAARTPRKPVVNVEPPYERHGMVGGSGRWSSSDVRRASWAGVLAGAGAGVGYAAHGVWMWSTAEGRFLFAHGSQEPATWVEAMTFPGVHDIALLGYLIRTHRLDRTTPGSHPLAEIDPRFRLAVTADDSLLALYFPYDRPVELARDFADYVVSAWDLAARAPFVPELIREGKATHLRPAGVAEDALIVAERRR
ncbi:DUF4038 domain-containing protein [Agromyces bauzanensis]|nr:DUF4038 domain-containing protein [Agromyces bauzanensis]